MGKGDFKNLKDELYGFSEAEECRKFWQKDENYQNFISIADKIQIQIGLEFFNQEEQTFFKKWQYKVYDPNDDEHVDIKNIQWQQFGKKKCSFGTGNRKTVARFWVGWEEILESEKLDKNKQGENVQAAIVKPYTWVKVFRNTDKSKDIFFTFRIDAFSETKLFIYKRDCQKKRDWKLTQAQIYLCRLLIPATAKWNEIAFEDLTKGNWDSLIETCVHLVQDHTAHYDAIIETVWGTTIQQTLFKNRLIKKEKPKDSYDLIPEIKKEFSGVDVDFQE